MMRVARTAGLVSLAWLAACGPGAVTTTYVNYDTVYSPSWFNYAAGGRDLRVVIRGNPTQAPQEEFDRAVIAAMQDKNWGARTNFTTQPSESAREHYRVVLLFGGERFAGGYTLCADPDGVDLSRNGSGLRLQAAFCIEEKPLTELQVAVNDVTSPSDPRLRRMVAAAVIELFPLTDFTRDDDCPRRILPNCCPPRGGGARGATAR